MIRTRLLILAAAVLVVAGPGFAKPPHKAPAKPAGRPSAQATAAPTRAFDASDPAGLVALLTAGGFKAQVEKKEADTFLVTAASQAANFSAQLLQCEATTGKGCKVALFDSLAEGAPSMVQINGYNQASAVCRGYMDHAGKAHVTMALLLFPDETRAHEMTAITAWAGCVTDFDNFAKNPVAYLAAAP